MLVGDNLPELCTDLVTALAGLDVDNFSHVGLSANQSLLNDVKVLKVNSRLLTEVFATE